MPALALREQLLLGSVLAAALAGMAVKHWRDSRREIPVTVVSPVPGPAAHASDAAGPDTP